MLRAAWTTITIKFGEMHTNMLNLARWNIWWPEWQMRRLPALPSAWNRGIVKLHQVRWSHRSTSVSLTPETLALKETTITERQSEQKRTQHNKENKTIRADQGGIEPTQKALVKALDVLESYALSKRQLVLLRIFSILGYTIRRAWYIYNSFVVALGCRS